MMLFYEPVHVIFYLIGSLFPLAFFMCKWSVWSYNMSNNLHSLLFVRHNSDRFSTSPLRVTHLLNTFLRITQIIILAPKSTETKEGWYPKSSSHSEPPLVQGTPRNIVSSDCLQSGYWTEARNSPKDFSEPRNIRPTGEYYFTRMPAYWVFGLTPREVFSWCTQPCRQAMSIKGPSHSIDYLLIKILDSTNRESQLPVRDRKENTLSHLILK